MNRSRVVPSLRQVLLSPFRSRVSSLPPSARANHVLLSRSPLSGVRPLRYRAQLVLRVRHESSFSSTTLSPFPPHADRRFGSRSCEAQVARAARRSLARSCCAVFARAARALREVYAPFYRRVFPHPSSIYHLARTRPLPLYPISGSILVALSAPCASRLLSTTLTLFLRPLLTRRLLFLSYTRAKGSPTTFPLASSSFLLFCVRHPTVTLVCRLSLRSPSHQSSCCTREQSLFASLFSTLRVSCFSFSPVSLFFSFCLPFSSVHRMQSCIAWIRSLISLVFRSRLLQVVMFYLRFFYPFFKFLLRLCFMRCSYILFLSFSSLSTLRP